MTGYERKGFDYTPPAGETRRYVFKERFEGKLVPFQGGEKALAAMVLAATALMIEALAAIPENVLVDGVHFDLPDTELDRVTLLPDWFYIGVYHPIRAKELKVFLEGYLRMFTPRAVSTTEKGQETKIKETTDKLLED